MPDALNQQTHGNDEPYYPLSTHEAVAAIQIAARAIVGLFRHCQLTEVQATLGTDLLFLCRSPWIELVDPKHPGCRYFVARKLRQVWAANPINWKRLNSIGYSDADETLNAVTDPSVHDNDFSVEELLELIDERLGSRARIITELRMERYSRNEIATRLQIPVTTHDYELKRISDVLVPYC